MALHQGNLWTVNSRANSSLDVMDALGGLTAGCLTLPEHYRHARGFRVYTTTAPHAPEDYGNINAMVTGIGGSQVTGLNDSRATIEFMTEGSTSGRRGIFKVDGLFDRPFNYSDPVTKGEAMRFMMPHGIDEYNWTGTKSVASGARINLSSLPDYSTDITQGSTTIKNGNFVVLPATPMTRGLIITAMVTGTYEGGSSLFDFRMQIRDGSGGTVIQDVASYSLTREVVSKAFTFSLFTNGIHDELGTTGFRLAFANDSSDSAFNLTGVRVLIQNISNPDFSLG